MAKTLEQIHNEKVKASLGRIKTLLPWVRQPAIGMIADKMATGEILETDVKQIDKALVFWPQTTGKLIEEPVTEDVLKQGLKAYNNFRRIVFGATNNLKTADVLSAYVKEFSKFELKGVRFLAVTLRHGKKFRYILDDLRSVNRRSTQSATTYQTFQPADA